MHELPLRIHSRVPHSRVNGPDVRAVVWTQGCSLGCPGCFNGETHPQGGTRMTPHAGVQWLASLGTTIAGVTISGGEPLQQPMALLALLDALRTTLPQLSIIVFTGYTPRELAAMPQMDRLPHLIDVLIAGRYTQQQRVASGLIGSRNKALIMYSDRYTEADFAAIPETEIAIALDGTITSTGINPLVFTEAR